MVVGFVALLGVACSTSSTTSSVVTTGVHPTAGPPPTTFAGAAPEPLTAVLAEASRWQWFTKGDDIIEVWVCHVPLDSTATIYAGMQLRQPLTPVGVVDVMTRQVTPYFDTLSHGQYHPVFRAGGEVDLSTTDEPQACVDEAVAGAASDTNAVFVVADAEHGDTQPGGFGTVGYQCDSPPCSVDVTGRSAYIGASDFHPDWGDLKAMDLAEHEIGHTLGWMHSGVETTGEYLSALDVMSNSAAPRDIDPDRRDAPDTLGVNRLLAGWLPISAVWVAPATGGTVTLAPSMSSQGTRLAVVAIDATHFLTIELLTADGFDAHLPADGIAVHRVEVIDGIIQDAVPLVGEKPFDKLLQVGGVLTTDNVRVTVDAGGGKGPAAEWTVTIVPSLGA